MKLQMNFSAFHQYNFQISWSFSDRI